MCYLILLESAVNGCVLCMGVKELYIYGCRIMMTAEIYWVRPLLLHEFDANLM